MPRYIALLRGINVGGHRVKMDRLRELFEALGFDDVATFIASGNVIFSAESHEAEALQGEIEEHLARELGYEVATFIRSPSELEAVAAFEPPIPDAGDGSGTSLYVIFLPIPAGKELRSAFADLRTEMDDFYFSEREVYWLIQGKLTESPLFRSGIEKATRDLPTTTRNMNTVRKLVRKLDTTG
jgi:uncharacterized protein (DUF1697 family)